MTNDGTSEKQLARRRGTVDQRIDTLEQTVEEHEERLTEIEKFKQRAYGAMIVLSVVTGSGAVGIAAELLGLV